jgi:hypothetical protein
MRHAVLFFALGFCSGRTVPLARTTIASAGDDDAIHLWTMPLPALSGEDLRKIEAAVPAEAAAAPNRC